MNSMKSPTSVIALCLVLVSIATAQDWSVCSKSCGGGTKSRKECLFGLFCSTVTSDCNTRACISGWDEWQPCSKTCGGGTRYRVVRCPLNNVITCPKIYGDCNTQPCKTLAGCPVGYSFRYDDPSSCCKLADEKCGADETASPRSRRFVGGEQATQGDTPWAFQVALVRKLDNVIYCGGALLNKRWLVTAGHCFAFLENLYVLLGSVTINNPASGHEIRNISEHIIHPDYQYPKHDIALGKMDKDVTYSTQIKPICLPTGEITPPDKTCLVGGWGMTLWTDHQSMQNHLQQIKVRTLPIDACIQGYKNIFDQIWWKINNTQHICAGVLSGGKGSCNSDSGVPLLCQRCSTCGWYLAGTLAYGPLECGRGGTPEVFMNIYNYQNWIRQHVSLSETGNYVC